MARVYILLLTILPFPIAIATTHNALYIGYNCTGSAASSTLDSNRASPSYLYNLYNLLGTFTSHASSAAYYNSSLGQTPNRVYAIYICRFDQTARSCNACINEAKDQILKACPYQTEAIIWYENCMIRYSKYSFFGRMDVSPWIAISMPQNSTRDQVVHFEKYMRKSMYDLAISTADNSSPKARFKMRVINITGFGSLYEMTQCVPEITTKDCHLCLTIAIGRLANISASARVLLPSCIVWYHTAPFYNSSAITYPFFNSSSATHPPHTKIKTPAGKS
ncbi:cysteine-rich receptor-like protein kinase 25 [Chenopodium quinoa]|uniref:cysteine-rich receptor-like protein kinase 25 n=1 Tax=Chenopodium quinoa TaxID=63459 RepID=UPI000B774939|nr:cysteine-rich receptor-like protein kinase 25 [Chenopodium quinoa]